MKKLKLLVRLFALVVCCVSLANAKISDRRLCADENCTKIISMARTVLGYNAIDPFMISFPRNKQVRVLSKAAGSNPAIWGIEVQGRRGYAPISHLQETEVYVKKELLLEVPTEPFVEKPEDVPPSAETQNEIERSIVQEDIVSSEISDNNATVPVELQEPQPSGDDNKVQLDAAKENTIPVEQSLPHEVDEGQNVVPETVNEQIEAVKPQEEPTDIREHDDEDDEGFDEEEEEEEQVEEIAEADEDDVKDYAGREPVTEPPVIKKDAYKTGEKEVENLDNAHVKLEIIGSEAKRPEDFNDTVSEVTNDAKEIEQATIVATEQIAPDVKNDEMKANDTTIESQTKEAPGATEKLSLADSVTVTESLSHTEIRKEEIETNETPKNLVESKIETIEPVQPIPNVKVEKIEEKPVDNPPKESVPLTLVPPKESVPLTLVPPKESVPLSLVEDKKNETDAIPTEPIKNKESDSAGDDFHIHIENRLGIKKESIVHPPIDANTIRDATTEYVREKRSQNDEQQKNTFDSNADGSVNNKEEVPAKIVVDPIEVVQTTEIPNVVEELPTPNVEEITEVPEIKEEALPVPNEIVAEELPAPTPIPILDSTEDIFTSKPASMQPGHEPFEPIETGNWYDDIVESVFQGYQSVLRLAFPEKDENSVAADSERRTQAEIDAAEDGYCEKLDDGSCPKHPPKSVHIHDHVFGAAIHHVKNVNYDQFAQEFLGKVVQMADLVVLLALTATAVLIFIFGHYCLANNHKESALISKLNIIEKKLLVSEKECSIVKADLIQTRKQLVSIEDSSFGSNDMVIALKQQLEHSASEKEELEQQIAALEKELETAAEAGLELNKMVSELLNNQSGSDSIISSVEELQRQLNEQEAMTFSINNLLAEKSRENSELQIQLSEKNGKYETELEELLKLNEDLKAEKESIESELRENIESLETQLKLELESKTSELAKLSKEHTDLKAKFQAVSTKCRMAEARVDALEDTLKKLKQIDGKADLKTVIEATDANAKLLALSRENESLKDKLEGENDARNLLEDHVKVIGDEVTRLRAEYNQAEKDKLEAQTRLEVLSNYFKEKETQLQKELSVKEALFMKQQGESTSTVERIRSLQDEIQDLKSQNDQLRAEIDAQSAAHKAQINAAESRAHDSWLAAKQAERRFEEIRAEAGVLRRKLTSLSTNPASAENSLQNHLIINGDGLIPNDVSAPSPIHLESPGSPLLNLVPPNAAPFLPPPPFIGAPPMGLPFIPPPPLVPLPPGEMRPPPLGRLMSPPPPPPPLHPSSRFQPNNFVDDRGRYDGRYSPDSRYDDYPNISTYETETDYSPPRSPEPRSYYRDRRDYDDEDDYSPRPSPQPVDSRKRKPVNKGGMSSGSIDSSSSRKSRSGTSKN